MKEPLCRSRTDGRTDKRTTNGEKEMVKRQIRHQHPRARPLLRGRTQVGQRWSLPIIYQIPLKSSFSDLPDPKRFPTGSFPALYQPLPGIWGHNSRKIQKCEKTVFSHFDILRAGYEKIVSISFNRYWPKLLHEFEIFGLSWETWILQPTSDFQGGAKNGTWACESFIKIFASANYLGKYKIT